MQHLIHTLNVTLRVPEMQRAFSMQERVKECMQAEWVTEIERVLDKYSGPDVYLQVDRLDIKLDALPAQHWEKHFQERFIEALDRALSNYGSKVVQMAANTANEVEDEPWGLRSASVQYQEAWMFFMQYGLLPWWMHQESAASLEEKLIAAIQQQPQRCVALWTRAWSENKIMVQRWVQQCSPELQRVVLDSLFGVKTTSMLTGREAMLLLKFSLSDRNVHLRKLQMLYWDVVLDSLLSSSPQSSAGVIKQQMLERWDRWMGKPASITETDILKRIEFGEDEGTMNNDVDPSPASSHFSEQDSASLPATSSQDASSQTNKTQQPDHPEKSEKEKLHFTPDLGLGEHLLVKQAGVIILHPFLQYLFKDLQWLDESGRSILPEFTSRAMHLLEFMASGEEDVPEYEMTLLKLLCGLPLDAPLERNVQLTTEEKEKSLELLQAVIKHWSALGTVSPDGLRGNFLLREGKLIFADDHWQLLIAPKAYDILLNQLPWGIGIIKLPWMEQLLKVQWTA